MPTPCTLHSVHCSSHAPCVAQVVISITYLVFFAGLVMAIPSSLSTQTDPPLDFFTAFYFAFVTKPRPHTVHCHAVRLPLGALLSP